MTIEQRTKNFFIGWPYYGDYVYKLNKIEFIVKNYLRKNFCNKRKEYQYAVIFDIDDTLVYTDGAKYWDPTANGGLGDHVDVWVDAKIVVPTASVNTSKLVKAFTYDNGANVFLQYLGTFNVV